MENLNIRGAATALRNLASQAEEYNRELTLVEKALRHIDGATREEVQLDGRAVITFTVDGRGDGFGMALTTATIMEALHQRRAVLRSLLQEATKIIEAATRAGLSVPVQSEADADDLPF